ncbi:MAG: hypothetical protein JST86_16185 [Bacteroidetes bacterium]|nr:hypothetical protein [Bacteroidota bacterium]
MGSIIENQSPIDTSKNGTIHVMDSVQYFARYNGDKQLVFVKDSLRGGLFFKYNGIKQVDNGIVFKDQLGQKWHRYLTGGSINVCWYGLKADEEKFDNYNNWLLMMESFRKIRINEFESAYSWKSEIIFPPSEKAYFFSHTLTIDYNMVISGGTGVQKYHQFSKLKFPPNTTGINLRFHSGDITGVSGTLIKDLFITTQKIETNLDTTKHGINSDAPVYIENVTVCNFSGHGINLEAPQKGKNSGSTDLSSVKDCFLVYNYDGLHIEGGESNACLIEGCNFSLNRRWGVNDLSFLGNTYIANHAASNCSVPGQRTLVCQDGHTFAALRPGADLKNPGIDKGWESDWFDFGKIGCVWGGAKSYTKGYYYEAGGAYSIDNRSLGNQNQRTVLLGCYAETDQPPSFLGNKSLSIGGINGVGFNTSSPTIVADGNIIYVNKYGIRTAPGDNKIFGILNQLGVTVQRENGEGLRMTYDTLLKMGKFLDQSTGESNTLITSGYSYKPLTGRASMLPGRIFNVRGVYFAHGAERSNVKLFDIINKKPSTTTGSEIGDISLATASGINDLSAPDDILYKVTGTPGKAESKEWTAVKGESEHLKTTTDTTLTVIETTFDVKRFLKLYVSGNCTDRNGNYYTFKKLFRVINRDNVCSLIGYENLETEVKSRAFANAGIEIKLNGNNVTTAVHGAVGDWQLFITREKQ